jgi:hypothetical protein
MDLRDTILQTHRPAAQMRLVGHRSTQAGTHIVLASGENREALVSKGEP